MVVAVVSFCDVDSCAKNVQGHHSRCRASPLEMVAGYTWFCCGSLCQHSLWKADVKNWVVLVVPRVVMVVMIDCDTGVWGIGSEVRKKPSLRWEMIVTNWLVSVVPMEVMVV
jgi:hypothetical protein